MEKAREQVKLSSECGAEGGFKQGKRFSEIGGLHVQNLAMVFLKFKNNFLLRLLKTGITKTGTSNGHARSANKK